MRRFEGFLLVYSVLTLPAVGQRGGRDFRGATGGFDRPVVVRRYPSGFVDRGFRGFGRGFPENHFAGFGSLGGWPGYAAGWDYPDYGYPDDSYSTDAPGCSSSIYYGYGPIASPVQQSPPRVTEYSGPAYTCRQVNGKPAYRIAVPADNRERKIPPTYQNNLWVAQDYSFDAGTLKFTTVNGEQKQTSLRFVDRALTLQLNRECSANFSFPQ